MMVGADAGTTQGHVGNGAAQRGPDRGAYAVTDGRATRWKGGTQATRRSGGFRAQATRDRKRERVPVDSRTSMVTDGRDERGNEDDMQKPSQQEVSHLLEVVAISAK